MRARQSPSVSSEALPPAAAVLTAPVAHGPAMNGRLRNAARSKRGSAVSRLGRCPFDRGESSGRRAHGACVPSRRPPHETAVPGRSRRSLGFRAAVEPARRRRGENCVKHLGRANAGIAVAKTEASVVLNNPAAMVNLDRPTLQADATAIEIDDPSIDGITSSSGSRLAGRFDGYANVFGISGQMTF